MAYSSSRLRTGAAILSCLAIGACSGGGPVVPLEDVGASPSNLALPLAPIPEGRVGDRFPDNVGDQMPAQPVQSTARGIDYLDTPNLAGTRSASPATMQRLPASPQAQTLDGQVSAVGTQSSQVQGSQTLDRQTVGSTNEVDMDSQFGFSRPVGLAEQEQRDIAEGDADQPIIDGVGTGNLRSVNGRGAISDSLQAPQQGVREEKVAFIPRVASPQSDPAPLSGGMPASEISCRRELQRLGVRFTDIPTIRDNAQCGIDYPMEVQSVGDVRVMPAAKLNCSMALTFARWTKNDLVPSARLRYFSGVKAIRQLSSYSCRHMNSKANNPWSEHARGNALDIGMILLNNGDEIDVRKPGFFSFRQKGLLNSVRADSCKYFNTVLGPGDPYHGDHFHFDLRSRKSGKRYCSLD